MCWLRVADDCFPASNFSSSWNFGSIQSGELATLQVDVRKYLARKPGWSRFLFILTFHLSEFSKEILYFVTITKMFFWLSFSLCIIVYLRVGVCVRSIFELL